MDVHRRSLRATGAGNPISYSLGSSPAKARLMMLGMSFGWRSTYSSFKSGRLKWLLCAYLEHQTKNDVSCCNAAKMASC
jgi:hypothetical protein